MKLAMTTGLLFAAAMPAFAQDAENGERQFARQCVACHVIVNDDGDTLAGRNARTGPNLYDMVARGIAGEADFNYGDSLVELREQGAEWTEDAFVGYVQDPTGWLREVLDDRRARGKMAYQVRDEQAARDIYAYLAGIAG